MIAHSTEFALKMLRTFQKLRKDQKEDMLAIGERALQRAKMLPGLACGLNT